MDASSTVTRLLQQAAEGNERAADDLLPLVYDELRRLARARLRRERFGAEHQPTSLVHQAYVRLVRDPGYKFENRAHFFAAAAEAMRRIQIERARRRRRLRHGGDAQRVTLEEDLEREEPRAEELLDLDRALSRLEARDAQMGNVVKLRYFAGLTVPETAEALDISARTVDRLWSAARAWLHDELAQGGG